ncbi:MAG: cyclic nucleotide-binding domain-containing protein [Opitutaceae bacterium]|jgi:Fe-S-cluster-containing dehydrogenase component/CRP-like cAMP-binding protein
MSTITSAPDRPRRWDAAFSDDITDADVQRLMAREPFRDMNLESFPRSAPLPDVLKNDARLHSFKKGEIIVREGDYGTSAFLVLAGTARVVIGPSLPPSDIGRREPARRGLFRALAQLWGNSREDEVVRQRERRSFLRRGGAGKDAKDVRIVLQDVPRVLDKHRTATIEEGDFFGEIAALSRIPRTATIFAEEDGTELLEIRWQGLRDLMRYDPKLRQHIDRVYRERALATYLEEIPFMKFLSAEAKKQVMDATQFETYGDYDWSGDYKKLVKSGASAAQEQTIASEGDYPNGVVMVRSGFARMTQRYGDGHRTLNYLGSGGIYGFDEIAHNWRQPDRAIALQHSLRVIGYTHVLVIPAPVIERLVLPSLPKDWLPPVLETEGEGTGARSPSTHSPFTNTPFTNSPFTNSPFTKTPFSKKSSPSGPKKTVAVKKTAEPEAVVGSGMMEFLTQNRFFNGTETMVIDMDRCTRCDDCVRACAATHDNNPRFLRSGPIHDNIMVAQACMHCADPICMIGCPTGAIHRDAFGGEVVINPATCIGCSACANNCPYGSIRMVELRDEDGNILVASDAKPIVKATKCDLCIDQYGGPACERACPHDAMKRMNLNTLDELAAWLQR